jgi:sugar lactone lactonase YvrE
MGCVADDEPFNPDSDNGPFGPEVADPSGQVPPPIVIDPTNEPQPAPAVFAANQVDASNLTITDESIYWVEFIKGEATLKWMHVDGGEHFEVGRLESLPFSTTFDENGLYFSSQTDNNIVFAPHLGLESELLHFTKSEPLAIQVTDNYAYWTAIDGCLYRGAKEGGVVEGVACGTGAPVSLAIADGTAFWSTVEGNLYSTALDAQGAADELASGQDFSAGIVADQSGVYWVDESNREVRRYSHATRTVSAIAESQYSPVGLAQDRFYLYFSTQGDGSVKRLLKAGGSDIDVMAVPQDQPGEVVAAGEFIYWVNEGDGSIMRLQKNFAY